MRALDVTETLALGALELGQDPELFVNLLVFEIVLLGL